jgi:serine protease
MQRHRWFLGVLATAWVAVATAGAPAGSAPAPRPATGRFIVKLRPGVTDATARRQVLAAEPDRGRALAERVALPLRASRALGHDLINLVADGPLSAADEVAAIARLAADPDVEFVERDERRQALAVAGDPLFVDQWYLQSAQPAASRFDLAWDGTTGLTDTVIAVLDTGIRFDHPDLRRTSQGGRLLPGYDFVSGETPTSFRVANDGDGWDPDPSDPGDWVDATDLQQPVFDSCGNEDSSWHGTRVAGIVGAITNNGDGIAGATWAPRVLPVRVLGKCGGYDSDIIAGMRWAAGLPVGGVVANPHPAKVLNLSLGSSGSCTRAYRDVLTELTAAGVVVVAAAGNVNGPVDVPARCPGVVGVGGLRHVGTKVGYSSQGAEVAIAAPAGNCVNLAGACLFSLTTTTDAGTTTPAGPTYTDGFNANIGTSFASPLVAAMVGLMHGVNPALRTAEFRARLQAAARPFPVEPGLPTCPNVDFDTQQCNCTTSTCGAGIADADRAVAEALRPIARIATPADTSPGITVELDGTDSAAARDRTLVAWSWSVVSGPAVAIANPGAPVASVVAPGNGTSTIALRVTDDAGRTDTSTLTVGGITDPVPPDTGGSSAGGGGGGGGAPDALVLASLAALGLRRPRQR